MMSTTLMKNEEQENGIPVVVYITTAEAVEILGVTDTRVKQLCHEGTLVATKPHGDRAGWRIELESVKRYDAAKREIERIKQQMKPKGGAD